MNTSQDFCLWLQGFVELQDAESISDTQWLQIKDHLKLVFDKVTPDRSNPFNITVKPSIGGGPDVDWTEIMKKFQQNPPYTITC